MAESSEQSVEQSNAQLQQLITRLTPIVDGLEKVWKGGEDTLVNNGSVDLPAIAKLVADLRSEVETDIGDFGAAVTAVAEFAGQAEAARDAAVLAAVVPQKFSPGFGPYPMGAQLLKADGSGYWQSTDDGNTTDPEAGGAGWFEVDRRGRLLSAASLRSLSRMPATVEIRSIYGDGGQFVRDPDDTTSEEDGGTGCGTIIRPADFATAGVYKRDFSGPLIPRWWRCGSKDGAQDDTAQYQVLLDAAEGCEIYNGDWTYRFTSEVTMKRDTKITKGNILADFVLNLVNADALLTQSVFVTRPIPKGESDDDITFEGVRCRSIGSAGSHARLFQSYSAIIVSGVPSRFVNGRTDYFKMIGCRAVNMQLCATFGLGVEATNNVARNFLPWTQSGTRHTAILCNQYISSAADVSHLDTDPSDCLIDGNRVYGFGGGICAHHLYNVEYPERRVMSATITGNTVIGNSTADEAANPDKKRSVYGIYCASLNEVIEGGNRVKNGHDMCYDFEFCASVTVSQCTAENGGFKFFWGDANDVTLTGITSICSEIGYTNLLSFTGTLTRKKRYKISNCTFRNRIPLLEDAVVALNTGTDSIEYKLNKHYDARFKQQNDAVHLNSYIEDNLWEVTVDRAALGFAPVVAIDWSGKLQFKRNEIVVPHALTPAVQGAGAVGLEIINRRIEITEGIFAGVEATLESNKITGFPISIHLGLIGSSGATWIAKLLRNEYDGDLQNDTATTTNRVFIARNWKTDPVTRQIVAAHPATPPATGTWARGSRITRYSEIAGTDGEVIEYVCSSGGAGNGGTWKSLVADYA